MLHKFLFIPVTLWLLLPPGICVCRGFGNLLPVLGSEAVAEDTGPTCEDSEHAPWCPVHKMLYLTDGGTPFGPDVDTFWVGVLPPIAPAISPSDNATSPAAPTAHPADSPIYLNLCALRI